MSKACSKSTKQNIADFYRSVPEIDECRYLIKKVLEQAVRDFIAFEHSKVASEIYDYQTAACFLFDDSYTISWGDGEMSLQDLLDWVDIEVEWVRKKVFEAKKRKQKRFSLKKTIRQRRKKENNDTNS